ncbi:MAG: transposase [Desulfobacteraceae bacterium]|nr:transposase [Desulfobacteraceae bacterium]
MPRQARLDAPGTLHHVIVRGIEKRRIIKDNKDREDFVRRMGEIALAGNTFIYAWALMTNHAHILLRSGPDGLSSYMRRLLTGYATRYNRRHNRHGHLFQNRYKSIICEEEPYFLELVRYIHLNPLRAGLVKDLSGLAGYRWSGHGVLMGQHSNDWQACPDVLERFGKTAAKARIAYEKYVSEGMAQLYRPDLVGGGLVRSRGGWSEVKALRKLGITEASDDRILGSGAFVERLLQEATGQVRRHFAGPGTGKEIEQTVLATCEQAGISIEELRSGSRRKPVAEIRRQLVRKLVQGHGVSLAESARQTGVSTSAISRILARLQPVMSH